ncbi:MAG: DEAD/DEAH box helicase family protein [Deltaproteobacteria bacterium]|nr:DEAD/DEAH box helicase family protein [Deltaproteobacteria bacterium]
MTAPEEKARLEIDRMLKEAGWTVQLLSELNLGASKGVAICEFPLKNGFADYLLFVDRKAVGVIEAKAEGTTLSGVADQSERYIASIPENLPHVQEPLPFAYESTGSETFFRDTRDPNPRSRRVFYFHRPETLSEWIAKSDTIRARLKKLPPLITTNLRDCQVEAITGLDESFADDRPRSLIQMATGSGKTFTAINFIYRLIKHADAKRILFLVDRKSLGDQTFVEFTKFNTPDDNRKFNNLYNVQHLSSNKLDKVSKVCITTIQRLYSMLRGEAEYEEEAEEHSLFDSDLSGERPKEVVYNQEIPIETFDFIVTDECHRSIYNLWRQVLEYFDAYLIGLTATPSKQTLGFFNNNLVMEYGHERAVADGVNVGYDVYRIKTRITEQGSKVESGNYIDKRNKLTRKVRWERLDEALEYDAGALDRDVVAKDQIRTVIKTFKEKICTEIFPGREHVPKTLIFAKNDSHAEDIVHIVREEFGKGNDFCKKITYRTTGETPKELIQSFRTDFNPRIAVTVDMVSTGTDIKPLECLLFMRNVRSTGFFEQMKGRGTRTIDHNELKSVTPDASHKTHFVIVDAVGVCETDKTDSRPLERVPSISFKKLVNHIAQGRWDDDMLTSLAGRLARLDKEIGSEDKEDLKKAAKDKSLRDIVNKLFDAVDPDKQEEKATELFSTAVVTDEQLEKAKDELKKEACLVFDSPNFRKLLLDIKEKTEQTIDTVTIDKVEYAGGSEAGDEKARSTILSFKKFMEDNKDELTALQIIYNIPYGKRHLTYEQIEELAKAIKRPPYNLQSHEVVWEAYERLDKSKVRGAGARKLLTNIVSLLRFTIGEAPLLEPFPDTVAERFDKWVKEHKASGDEFTPEQLEWLRMIKDFIAKSLSINVSDFELPPFFAKGGPYKAKQVFGDRLETLLNELNEVLAA